MTVTETIEEQAKADMIAAMKSGDKQKTNALRLVVSELQKAAKEGRDDELTVLRRERKRRLESAKAFKEADRGELADAEEYEAELLAAYLPAEMSDADLEVIVGEKITESGATGPQDMGAVMKLVMPVVDGKADGKRVSEAVKRVLLA